MQPFLNSTSNRNLLTGICNRFQIFTIMLNVFIISIYQQVALTLRIIINQICIPGKLLDRGIREKMEIMRKF